MSSSKKPWESYGKAAAVDLRIPTVPRIAPHPISSGISSRELPEARLIEIVKCCQHYEAKCAGLYSAKTPAARFLFDLSREVQDLCRVLVSREDAREDRVEHLEGALGSWQQIFARPSQEMQAIGVPAHNATPADVARVVLQQAAARRRAEDERRIATTTHREEMAQMQAAMRDQAAAGQAAAAAQVDAARRATARQSAADARRAREAAEAADAAAAAAAEAARRDADEEWQAELEAQEGRFRGELEAARRDAEAAVAEARGAARRARAEAAEAGRARDQANDLARRTRAALQAAQEASAAQEREHGEALVALREDAQGALAATEQRHRASVEAGRLRQLEGHCDWLSRRVAQLEGLVESLSGALRRAGKSGAAAAGAVVGGAQSGGKSAPGTMSGAGVGARSAALGARERRQAALRPFVGRTRPGVGVRSGGRSRPATAGEKRGRGLGKGRGVPMMGAPGGSKSRGRQGAVLAWVEGPAVGGVNGGRAGPVFASFGGGGGGASPMCGGAGTTTVDGRTAAAVAGADLVVMS